jgi:hypothetical protein
MRRRITADATVWLCDDNGRTWYSANVGGGYERSLRTGLSMNHHPGSYTQKLWMLVKRKAAYLPG